MTTLQKNQKKVTEIETKYSSGLVKESDAELITSLRDYVDAADYIGVEKEPKVVVAAVSSKYNSITNLPEKVRKGGGKKNLMLCIIGNFIDNNGCPPPNVMWRFCNEYLGVEE